MDRHTHTCTCYHDKNDFPEEKQHSDAHVAVISSLDINYIHVLVHKSNTKCLVDTGACISYISLNFLRSTFPHLCTKLQPSRHQHVYGVGGETHQVLGAVDIPIPIQSKSYIAKVHIFKNLHHNLILGRDFLKQHNAIIDLGKDYVTFDEQL